MALKQSLPIDTYRQFDRLSFVTRRAAQAGMGGEHASRRRAPSSDFVDYRPYHPGDDFRRVDWNVYGRLGSLQVKLTEGLERLDVHLILDCSSSMAFGDDAKEKLSYATRLVGALAYIALARADSVRITCLGNTAGGLGPFRRRGRLTDVLRELATIVPAGQVDLNASLAATMTAQSPSPSRSHSLVVIVSDLLSPNGVQEGLTALRANQADVVVIHLVSPDELDPHLAGEVELIDAETGEVLELGISLQTVSAYRERFGAWLEERAAECRGQGVRYVRVTSNQPLVSVVMDDLRRVGVLR